MYYCSKFALEGATETIAKEMLPEWNIKFLILEPGGIKTEYAGSSMVYIDRHPAYAGPDSATSQLLAYLANPETSANWGDAAAVARVLIDAVSHQGDRALPLRLPMGSEAYAMIVAENEAVVKDITAWKTESESVSKRAQLDSVAFLRK
jgi:NAD(P)-dependent dehydrogenase (short-subunit alcohol dehydrogenase family)